MLTWTKYGTWLQGDERGYVKDGVVRAVNEQLKCANRQLQLQGTVYLSSDQRETVRRAIAEEARTRGQHICALSVGGNHVHVVLRYSPDAVSGVVARYKTAGRLALRAMGHTGKLWTRGYDERFCFDEQSLDRRIEYVQGQCPRLKPGVKRRAK